MKQKITFVLLFVIVNLALCWLHIKAFQSTVPASVIATLIAHILLLIWFPYRRILSRRASLILPVVVASLGLSSCGMNRVEPNYEGVLMQNYGRNGKTDFKAVSGAQGILGPGSELYQVPMFEQKADPAEVSVTAKDAGYFSVDPTYSYQPLRGKGIEIVFNYKHIGISETDFMDKLEANILNPIVLNAYREQARNYSTDSLMNNLNGFESSVESRLQREFEAKGFSITTLSSGLKPPQSMIDAVERRNNAIQQAEQVRNELVVAQMNLEKAKIDAEANRVRTTGLSNANLQEQYIEMLRTTSNKVIITDGKTPVMLSQ